MTTRENNMRIHGIGVATLSMGSALLVTSQASIVHAAALEETAKNTGSKVITFLILLTVVLGAAGAALGIAMMASGSQVLHSSGTKRVMIGLSSIVGILCLGLGVTWIVQTVTGAGGGFTWQWPF
ncbi:hypothetical protein [Weissella paramesenteroides]|uniref:hypothetical protein n=1 Tax=Weissella paramesenteroides TaxID=1249 RepID=UPI0013D9B890|nr:hypothetical protein [Weissella paramesenteroides]NEZ89024.1 hypothetical protein [Weissella paramesenteroides]NFB03349.1 hypothetical protein [Weissella paramesenteroides]